MRDLLSNLLGLTGELLQLVIATLAITIVALDSLGFINFPWISQNLAEITFVAVCALIISSVIERRAVLRSFHKRTDAQLFRLEQSVQLITDAVVGQISGDLFLKDRQSYGPIEVRTNNATELYIVGKSLIGFVGMYEKNISLTAEHGSKWRFVMQHESTVANDERLTSDIRVTLAMLKRLTNLYPGMIEVKLSKRIIYCSIIAANYGTSQGIIQVELYSNAQGMHSRPHFDLLATRDQKWYGYYKHMLDQLWEQSESCSFS